MYKGLARLSLQLARCCIVSHREELMQCLTPRVRRVRHRILAAQSPGEEKCVPAGLG
jgi:hypothetical protein